MSTFFWVLIIVGSLFLVSNLGKVKASKKQTNRDNRINRFREPNQQNIIESDYKEEKKDEE